MEELLESGLREHVSPLSCGAPRGRNCVFLLSTPHAQASQVSQMVENLSAMQETWVQSLSQEDPLEKDMATHSSILAWRIHEQRSAVGYIPWGRKESDTTE